MDNVSVRICGRGGGNFPLQPQQFIGKHISAVKLEFHIKAVQGRQVKQHHNAKAHRQHQIQNMLLHIAEQNQGQPGQHRQNRHQYHQLEQSGGSIQGGPQEAKVQAALHRIRVPGQISALNGPVHPQKDLRIRAVGDRQAVFLAALGDHRLRKDKGDQSILRQLPRFRFHRRQDLIPVQGTKPHLQRAVQGPLRGHHLQVYLRAAAHQVAHSGKGLLHGLSRSQRLGLLPAGMVGMLAGMEKLPGRFPGQAIVRQVVNHVRAVSTHSRRQQPYQEPLPVLLQKPFRSFRNCSSLFFEIHSSTSLLTGQRPGSLPGLLFPCPPVPAG